MMYPYLEFDDGTEVVHSEIKKENGQEHVYVHFERPVDGGFDDARCVLPEYEWKYIRGYTPSEIEEFTKFLKNNAYLIFKYAANGGLKLA